MSEAIRDTDAGMIAGVASGIARRYGVSPLVVRAGWLIAALLTGGLALALYPVAAWLMPSRMASAEPVAGPPIRPAASPGDVEAERDHGTRMAMVLGALLWLMVAALLAQVYLAGGFLMGGMDAAAAHQALGYTLTHLYPFVLIVVALIAGMGRRFWLPFLALFVLLQVQPMLTYVPVRDGLGWMRALHPVNGTLLLLLTAWLAVGAPRGGRR